MKKKLISIMCISLFIAGSITANAQETLELNSLESVKTQSQMAPMAVTQVGKVTITPYGDQIIPTAPLKTTENIVDKGIVLYRIKFRVQVLLMNGQPAKNIPVIASTSSTSVVKGMKTINTDSNGIGYIEVDVRGVNRFDITAKCNDGYQKIYHTPNEACNYQSQFYTTAYQVEKETEYIGSKQLAPGISNYTFKSDFLAKTQGSGSGIAENGKGIKYDTNKKIFYWSEPLTATGTTPTIGRTIAVDNYYIPQYLIGSGRFRRGYVSVSGLGYRTAEDGGGAIKKYHIDEFKGYGKSATAGWSNIYRTIKFVRSIDG